jgi:UDP-glucuronate decarboxylase
MTENIFKEFLLNNLNKEEIPRNKKILITGCSGFIGTLLVECLANVFNLNNNIIYGVDRIAHKKKYKNFIFFKKNLYKLKKNNIPNFNFDYIIHLAGIPSPIYYKKYPLKTIFLNAELTRELLEVCVKKKSKFIYFSSSEIYGNPLSNFIPTKEWYNGNVSCISDRSCYDESKRMGETFCYIFKNNYKVNTKIIRPFNFYGEGMKFNDERIIPKFFSQILSKKPITIFSNGKQTRSYCHIYDAVVMIIKIIFKGKNFVYNVGNPNQEISAKKLAYKIKKTVNAKNSKLKTIPYPKEYPSDEPSRRCPSLYNFNLEFNYKPKIDLNLGLKKFYIYAKKNFIQF